MAAHASHSELDDKITQRCEESLHEFIIEGWNNTDPQQFLDGPHIGIMCEYLEAFVAGEIPRLLINIPPGHMKSLASSVFLNAWAWISHPGHRFMATSYRGDLAFRDADKTRSLVKSAWYQDRWGDRFNMRRDQSGVQRFANDKGGYRFSTSTSGIMGEGGDFVILDDPHNVIQAESDHVRDATVRLIRLALPTRVRSKEGGALVIMQRLHKKDYAGAMIADAADLVHLCLPARFEYDHPYLTRGYILDSGRELPGDPRLDEETDGDLEAMRLDAEEEHRQGNRKALADYKLECSKKNGELLFPNLFNETRIDSLAVEMSSYGIAGQLQQRPSPREGGLFQRHWFEDNMITADELPRERSQVRAWDPAGSVRKTSPYTAGVKMSRYGDTYYIEHSKRERWPSGEMEKNVVGTANVDGYDCRIDFPQDPGQAGKSQVKQMAQMLSGYVFRSSPETGSKEARAEVFGVQCYHNNVKIVRGDWNDDYIDEMVEAPTGDYMDQVDATSRGYAHLLNFGGRPSAGVTTGSY